jgi:predicted alpha/beta-fold hydrolase
MEFTPWLFALNQHFQSITYILYEIRMKIWFPLKYEREIFVLSDGGTLALDWAVDYEGGLPLKGSPRPILTVVSGLSGGNDNGYLYS